MKTANLFHHTTNPAEDNRKYQSRLGHMGHADTYHVTKAIEYDLLFWEFEQTQSGLLVPV